MTPIEEEIERRLAQRTREDDTFRALAETDPRLVVLAYIENQLDFVAEERSILLMEKESMRLWPDSWGTEERQAHAKKGQDISKLIDAMRDLLERIFPEEQRGARHEAKQSH